VTGRFTTSDGLSLHYEDKGEGLPVLCLAGLTRTARDFDFVAPHLPSVRLIRMDYRGRGQSDRAQDHLSYSIPVEARDALELLDHLGVARAVILGTSRGGLIAMLLAATAKERLLGLILNDIGPELNPAGLDAIMLYLGRDPDAPTLEALAREVAQAKAGIFRGVPHERWLAELSGNHVETPDGVRITYDPRLRDAVIEAGAQGAPDMWPLFDAIAPLPAAVIRGANSNLLSAGTVAEMKRRNPALVTAEVPDRGHVPFLDEPEALAAIRTVLDRVE